MTVPNHSDFQDGNLDKVLRIINRLARKSAKGDYIYRGEPRLYKKVSSSLYRKLHRQLQGFMDVSEIPVEVIQTWILSEAEKFTTSNSEILAQLQHYGGETNLIDFTTDSLTALFFACDGANNKNGRVIFLSKSGDMRNHITWPSNPANRVIAQKSVFVRPSKGYIEPDDTILIPHKLKQPILDYLRICHDISTESIYNDFHGFIRVQALHQQAYARLYAGITCYNNEDWERAIEYYNKALDFNPRMTLAFHNRGLAHFANNSFGFAINDFSSALNLDPNNPVVYYNRGLAYYINNDLELAINNFNKALELDPGDIFAYYIRGDAHSEKGEYDLAIQDYSMALDLNPDDADAYYYRGVAWLFLSEWEYAESDLVNAINIGADIKSDFNEEYGSIAEFEQQYDVELPGDIKAMLA